MRIIAVANQKGGCGKTTTSINFAACLAFLQKKTLLIDLDPQGHTTCGLSIKQQDHPFSLYNLLTPRQRIKAELSSVICTVEPNLFLIPTYGNLVILEEELTNAPARELLLAGQLQEIIQSYPELDYVVLDCPPNLGLFTYSALKLADEIIIPIEPSFFSLHGLAKISETINITNQQRTEPLELHALLTIFDSRTCFAKEIYEEVKNHFGDRLFKSIIHESVYFREAASAGQSIVRYDRNSTAFQDYFNLAVEYLEKEWDRVLPSKKLGWNQVLRQHYGPRKVPGGVLFQAVSNKARGVEIAGDFNNWIPEPLVRRDHNDGLWQKVLPITQTGSFRYKFIVDGEWQIDPYQPMQQPNAFGSYDSLLEIH